MYVVRLWLTTRARTCVCKIQTETSLNLVVAHSIRLVVQKFFYQFLDGSDGNAILSIILSRRSYW